MVGDLSSLGAKTVETKYLFIASAIPLPLLLLIAKELCLKALFDKVGKFWPPRPRSKKQLDEQPAADVADPPAEADPPADEVVAGDPEDEEPLRIEGEESSLNDSMNDGASTPPVSIRMNDEYLAWTLGGELRQTPSPGPPWKPDSPKEQQELDAAIQSLEDADLDNRIHMLENLVGKDWDCQLFVNPCFSSPPGTCLGHAKEHYGANFSWGVTTKPQDSNG